MNSLKLRATIASDVHIDVKHSIPTIPTSRLCKTMSNAKRLKSDAFIVSGDVTSHGGPANWALTRTCFEKIKNCAPNIILATGNHDCWGDDEQNEFASGMAEYFSGCLDIMGRKLDNVYYSTEINGYSFICLGNEGHRGCAAYLSDEQLAWLDAELKKATEGGRPAFVICHQSLNGRHGLPGTWEHEYNPTLPADEGGVGAQSEALEKVLKSYKNVFFISGHTHMGFAGEKTLRERGFASFEREGELHLINLPSLSCGNFHGEYNKSIVGIVIDVYDDRVVIRPRNFEEGRFIKDVAIKDGKPYYEVKL